MFKQIERLFEAKKNAKQDATQEEAKEAIQKLKIGTILYGYENGGVAWIVTHIREVKVEELNYSCTCIDDDWGAPRFIWARDIGKTVFLSKQELEAHLLEKLQSLEDIDA